MGWSRSFVWSASVILAVTGLAKVVSSQGRAGLLEQHDPLFGISFHYLLLLAGTLEVIVSAICMLVQNLTLVLFVIASLATNILLYRFGLTLVGYQKPCPCLGSLTGAIHMSPHVADLIMKLVLLYLTVFSFAALLAIQTKGQRGTKNIN